MKVLAWTVAVFGMIAGSIKVYNELRMTAEYSRWADASVRQAEALERIANGMRDGLYLTDDGMIRTKEMYGYALLDKMMRLHNRPAKVKEVRLR